MAKKYTKVGTVMSKKDNTGVFVALGNDRAKNKKYQFFVELVVKDADGNQVATTRNGILSVQDPRKRPGITEEQLSKIPDNVKHELVLVTEE